MDEDVSPPPESDFERDLDNFIAALARLFVHKGNAAAVAVLSQAAASLEYLRKDEWGRSEYWVKLNVPQTVFNSVIDQIDDLERTLRTQAEVLIRRYGYVGSCGFVISPQLISDPDWRSKAKAWVKGETCKQSRARKI